jgi:plastocyanin
MNARTRPLLVAGVLATALLGAGLAGVVAHAGAAAAKVVVTEREFHITLAPAKVKAGPTTFVVKNTGKLPHALAIAGPGVASKRTAMISPGKSAQLTVTLRGGSYSVWCPVPSHAAQGMKAKLAVTGTAPAATSGGGSTGTGGGDDGGTVWG